MRVLNNLSELVGLHALQRHQQHYTQALTRLSTGKRINRAADDPAGTIAAERLDSRKQALHKLISDTEFASHALSAREGALQSVDDLLIDLQGLIVSAANKGALGENERTALQEEAASIISGIEHIVASSTFNGRHTLADTQVVSIGGGNQVLGAIDVSTLGAEISDDFEELDDAPGIRIARGNGHLNTVGLLDIRAGVLNLFDGDLETALRVVDRARTRVTGLRAQTGALQRYGIDSSLAGLRNELENTAAAQSQIEDADFAAEASNLVRTDVLAQATTAVILASRASAANTLALLG
ncbi:MAG: flagellin [Phycisphaerales bacterium]|nr:flagellin [Phycisphaerales bacterium]